GGRPTLGGLVAVKAQRAVVEVDETLAESRRTASVGGKDRSTAGEQHPVVAPEARPLLAFRAAVEREHRGEGRSSISRAVEPSRELETIMCGKTVELGTDELLEIHACMRALGDAPQPAGLD